MSVKLNKRLLFFGSVLLAFGVVIPLLASWILLDRGSRLEHSLNAISRDIGWLLIVTGGLVAASAFVYHHQIIRSSYIKIVVPLLMVFTSIGAVLITTEVVLHLMYRDVQVGGSNSPSGFTFYRKYYKYNSWGFRDIEREEAKRDGTFRILVLGDSFTFGSGVKFKEQLYPALLETKLNSANLQNGHFEVINTGVKGLSTEQELFYLRETGLALNPDLIILGHVLNDAETQELKHGMVNEARSATILPIRYHRFLSSYSFTYYLVRRNIIGLIGRVEGSGNGLTGYNYYLDSLYQGDNLVSYKRIVADLARVCEERGLTVLWVSFPRIRQEPGKPYRLSHITDILRSIALKNGFKFLDLQPKIRERDKEELTVSSWDDHPNEVVHSIAAEVIYNRLIEDELIPISANFE